jgi:hypothetical protein
VQGVFTAAHVAALAGKPPQCRSEVDLMKLRAQIARVPQLAALSDAGACRLAAEVHSEVHLPGSIFMRQGDKGGGMVLLLDGSAHVLTLSDEELAVKHRIGAWSLDGAALQKRAPLHVRLRLAASSALTLST